MGFEVELQVGPRIVQDGATTEIRGGRSGAQIVSDAHGRYHEANSRGYLFTAATAVAGVAPGTVLSTTPPMALWNPPGSGVNLSIIEATMGYVSGTIGAGTVVWAYVLLQTSAPTTGTILTPVANLISLAGSKGKAFQGSTVASTPLILKPAFTLQATLATAPATGGFIPAFPCKDDVAGLIAVPPGAVVCLQGVAAAGTSPLVLFGLTWEEAPI